MPIASAQHEPQRHEVETEVRIREAVDQAQHQHEDPRGERAGCASPG